MGTKLFLQALQEGKIEQAERMLDDQPQLTLAPIQMHVRPGISPLCLPPHTTARWK